MARTRRPYPGDAAAWQASIPHRPHRGCHCALTRGRVSQHLGRPPKRTLWRKWSARNEARTVRSTADLHFFCWTHWKFSRDSMRKGSIRPRIPTIHEKTCTDHPCPVKWPKVSWRGPKLYDFEARMKKIDYNDDKQLKITIQHILVSVSINSNMPGYDTAYFICNG